ncbi:hypothetical protein [Pararobbsia silviterrae]|nr:hypothetical protein [Pararobbsia silviterrae]
MASILQVGNRWRAQIRKRGQSIAKTFRTKGAAEQWAREREVEIDNGSGVACEPSTTLKVLIAAYREARANSGRPVAPKSNEHYVLNRLDDALGKTIAARLSTQDIVRFARARM